MSKKSFVVIMALGITSLLIILESCKKEDIEIGRSALEYAYECESVLGPLPEFKFEDAIEIPMTKDGVPLTHGSDNANDCDHPFAFNAPCDPGNRMGRY